MIPANTWNQRTARFSHSRMEKSTLSSSISGVAVCAQQQRNMEVRFSVAHPKCNFDERIERFDFARREISGRIKVQAIEARTQVFIFEQLAAPAILIGLPRRQQPPGS